MMVKILTLEYTANKKYTIYTLRKMDEYHKQYAE